MSSRVSPASAIAASAASTASAIGSSIRRRPTREMPRPVIATWSSNLSAPFGIGRAWRALGSLAGNGPLSVSPVGSNSGIQTSAACSNVTCTFMPTNTSSAATFTRLVVRRIRSSSSMATMAIRYGGGKLGIHICSLWVKPATTPRPDTSVGCHSVDRQYGHTALGGWRSSPHSEQRWKRSFPSSPDFQKNSLISVSSGSSRPLDSVTLAPRISLVSTPSATYAVRGSTTSSVRRGREREEGSGSRTPGSGPAHRGDPTQCRRSDDRHANRSPTGQRCETA